MYRYCANIFCHSLYQCKICISERCLNTQCFECKHVQKNTFKTHFALYGELRALLRVKKTPGLAPLIQKFTYPSNHLKIIKRKRQPGCQAGELDCCTCAIAVGVVVELAVVGVVDYAVIEIGRNACRIGLEIA